MTQFAVIKIYDLSLPSANDVFRPRPSISHCSMPWCDVASDAKDFLAIAYMSGAECTGQGNESKLILTVKMESRHPAEGSFGNEFSSIYNHCGVMAA